MANAQRFSLEDLPMLFCVREGNPSNRCSSEDAKTIISHLLVNATDPQLQAQADRQTGMAVARGRDYKDEYAIHFDNLLAERAKASAAVCA